MTEKREDATELEVYLRIWSETVASVLSQITGKPLSLEAGSDASATPFAAGVFLNITLAGALRGEQTLGFSDAQARWFAETLLGEPAAVADASPPAAGTAEITAEQQEAVEELFRQVAGRVVSALKPSWGEVQIHVQAGAVPSWAPATTAWLQAAANADPSVLELPLVLELRISAALAASLRRPEGVPAAAETASRSPVPNPSPPHGGEVNLDYLKNVPLDLTLRFGQRRMPLREILELGPGSVIELDRRLREPVDLLLDGQVLARGEVVVIQGCYGLRVTEIAAREVVER
jgi:flagellar motor switch protein FliN/FliY